MIAMIVATFLTMESAIDRQKISDALTKEIQKSLKSVTENNKIEKSINPDIHFILSEKGGKITLTFPEVKQKDCAIIVHSQDNIAKEKIVTKMNYPTSWREIIEPGYRSQHIAHDCQNDYNSADMTFSYKKIGDEK